MNASLWNKLFSSEVTMGENWRWLATAYVLVFAITYAVLFPGVLQYVAYLGPGLGDDWSFAPFLSVFDGIQQYAQGNWLHPALWGFVLLWIMYVLFTGAIIWIGYALYPQTMGKPFPVDVMFTYFGLTIISTLGIGVVLGLFGLIASLLGFTFMEGVEAYGKILGRIREWVNVQVPTIVDMPVWLAFLAINMIGGFFHYWFHRLAHESRFLWLLFHRTHHMTPELTQSSAQAVFTPFPLFFLAGIPYVLIFSVIGKLITSESIIAYLIIYKLFSTFANMWSHTGACYQWAQRQWIIRVLSTITSEGVYHYLHHSAEPQHNQPRGNLINIGGGLFFFWDRVFGTYVPVSEYRPRVGLQEIPPEEVSTNPLRLALSGSAQLIYELKHNPLRDWFWILFGATDYVPHHSKEYVRRDPLITPG